MGTDGRSLDCRYGTYKLVQGSFGGDKLVGFTRILHRTQPDVLMDEASFSDSLLRFLRGGSWRVSSAAYSIADPTAA